MSVTTIEDKILLPSIPNNSSICGDDDAVSVIGLKGTAIGLWTRNSNGLSRGPCELMFCIG